MKTKICLFSLLLAASLPASAALYTSSTPVVIPDNNTLGTGSSLQFNVGGEGSSLSALTLTFALQGGYSTDLSGYLRMGSSGGSPSYDLTSLIQGQTLSSGSATSYMIDFTTSGFATTFDGGNPNTTWTLFFADNSALGQTTVNGWSLDVTAVPEPVNVALAIFGGVLAVWSASRRRSNAAAQPAILTEV